MVVLSIEKYEPAVRGMFTRFMTELRASVFVGDIPANTREYIWKYVESQPNIDAIMIYNANNEQGFSFHSIGNPSRSFQNFDGVQLLTRAFSHSEAYSLWAKPGNARENIPEKKLISHMLETGWTAEYFLSHTSLKTYLAYFSETMHLQEMDVLKTISFICAMHDIGKCHPLFQAKNGNAESVEIFFNNAEFNRVNADSQGFRHELFGALYIEEYIKQQNYNTNAKKAIADIITMHHVKNGFVGDDVGLSDKWTTALNHIVKLMETEFSPVPFALEKENMDAFCGLVLGILMIADWTASDEIFEDLNVYMFSNRTLYKEEVARRLEKYVDDNCLRCYPISAPDPIKKVFPFTKNWTLNPLQKNVEEYICDEGAGFECMLIESEMGSGKTEAAMYAAVKACEETGKGGIYFALPTEATSEAMQPRMNELLHAAGIDAHAALYTGNAWLKRVNDYDADCSMWSVPSSMKFLRPYACGTIDQLMTCIKKVKHGMINLSGIADKVIVIDEFHAYDAYMLHIITVLLAWLRALRTPVIILSATLPNKTKRKLFDVYHCAEEIENGYPLLSVCKDGRLRQRAVNGNTASKVYKTTIMDVGNDLDAIVAKTTELLQSGGCLDVIMNTVAGATQVFEKIQALSIPCFLFHSRFPISTKEKIAQEMIRLFGKDRKDRPAKAVVVATQVLEQSIDLDFDYTISELCPIDLLLQRMGREWRHANAGTIREHFKDALPETIILCGRKNFIYPNELLDRTLQYLRMHKTISLPQDIRPAVDEVYRDVADTENAEIWMQQENTQSRNSKMQTLKTPGSRFQLKKYRNILSETNSGTRDSQHGSSTDVAIIPHELFEKIKTSSPAEHIWNYSFEDAVNIRENMTVRLRDRVIDAKCGYDSHYSDLRYLGKMILIDEDESIAELDPVFGFRWKR